MSRGYLPPPRPLPIKNRISFVNVAKGQLDVIDGAFVLVDAKGVRMQIPVGSIACILLEPGIRITHAAAVLASRVGTLLIWVGEAGVRLYSAGQPGGARSDKLLYQARIALDDSARLKVVRKMYELRFGVDAPLTRSVDQLRGLEGARVRRTYQELADKFGVDWKGRSYDPKSWGSGDLPNRCLSAATACLYGVAEAAILAAGYAPAIGFLHTGKARSFVYDIADIVKFESVVPAAFEVASAMPSRPEQAVRHACRNAFRSTRLLKRLIPLIEEVLAAGEIVPPQPPPEAAGPAFEDDRGLADDGHRT